MTAIAVLSAVDSCRAAVVRLIAHLISGRESPELGATQNSQANREVQAIRVRSFEHSRQWIQDRMWFLVGQFGFDAFGFAVEHNQVLSSVQQNPSQHLTFFCDSGPKIETWSRQSGTLWENGSKGYSSAGGFRRSQPTVSEFFDNSGSRPFLISTVTPGLCDLAEGVREMAGCNRVTV